MMISDPWGLLLNQRGGGSIDMSRGFSGLGNLPPLDWMPAPGAAHDIDVQGQFPWNVADAHTYFRWYESVLFVRAREANRRLLLQAFTPIAQILLAGKFEEMPLDPGTAPRVFLNSVEYERRDYGAMSVWIMLAPAAAPVHGVQPGMPPKTMPDWLEQFAPDTGSEPGSRLPVAPVANAPTDALFDPPAPRAGGTPDLFGLLSWTSLSPPIAPQVTPQVTPQTTPQTTPRWAPPAAWPTAAAIAPFPGMQSGHSIAPPPPISGSTNSTLYFRPGYWQVHQTGIQAWQSARPDWGQVASGIVAAPLGYLEEGIVRPVLNIPHNALNKVLTAGQHFDRASLWIQQDEWAEASADALEGGADLALAFLDVAGFMEALGWKSAAPAPRRAALPREMPTVPTGPSFANLIDNDAFGADPVMVDRLSRARQFDIGGYKSLTGAGEFGRAWDGLDSDEALQNAFVRQRRGVDRHAPMLADNPATALSPELHRQIQNLRTFEALSAREVLRLHLDQMRAFAPEYMLNMLEKEAMIFIELHGL